MSKAEAVCLQLDEGPSLTFVYGNLGLLYSKTLRRQKSVGQGKPLFFRNFRAG